MISRTTGKIDGKFGVTSTDIVNLYNFATMEFPEALEDEIQDDELDEKWAPYINQMKQEREERLIKESTPVVKIFPKVKMPEEIMM
jgi:hypothetical protein